MSHHNPPMVNRHRYQIRSKSDGLVLFLSIYLSTDGLHLSIEYERRTSNKNTNKQPNEQQRETKTKTKKQLRKQSNVLSQLINLINRIALLLFVLHAQCFEMHSVYLYRASNRIFKVFTTMLSIQPGARL